MCYKRRRRGLRSVGGWKDPVEEEEEESESDYSIDLHLCGSGGRRRRRRRTCMYVEGSGRRGLPLPPLPSFPFHSRAPPSDAFFFHICAAAAVTCDHVASPVLLRLGLPVTHTHTRHDHMCVQEAPFPTFPLLPAARGRRRRRRRSRPRSAKDYHLPCPLPVLVRNETPKREK